MTENPLNTVIASDRRERGNLVFRVTTQPLEKGGDTVSPATAYRIKWPR
jgi:hypothetical protein